MVVVVSVVVAVVVVVVVGRNIVVVRGRGRDGGFPPATAARLAMSTEHPARGVRITDRRN